VVHGALLVSIRTVITPWLVMNRTMKGCAACAALNTGIPLNRSAGIAAW
jgi:hypothetical protein